MEMGTDGPQLRQLLCEFFRHDSRLQRPQPHPLDSGDFIQPLHEVHQAALPVIFLLFKIQAVGRKMDARENNLPVSLIGQGPGLLHDVLRLSAAHSSPGIGDNAVAAELIASVLNLQERSRMLRRMADVHILELPGLSDVDNIRELFPGCKILLQAFHQVLLPVISDDDIHGVILREGLPRRLHIAPGCHHGRLRVQFLCPVQHLSGLLVRNIRHGAGIDDIDIRLLRKVHDLIARCRKHLSHRLGLPGINLTSQVMKRRFSHITVTPVLTFFPSICTLNYRRMRKCAAPCTNTIIPIIRRM